MTNILIRYTNTKRAVPNEIGKSKKESESISCFGCSLTANGDFTRRSFHTAPMNQLVPAVHSWRNSGFFPQVFSYPPAHSVVWSTYIRKFLALIYTCNKQGYS